MKESRITPIPHALVHHGAITMLLTSAAGSHTIAQQPIPPLAIEDAVGAAEFQVHGGLGALSPDEALIAYASCDPRRIQNDTTSQVRATIAALGVICA